MFGSVETGVTADYSLKGSMKLQAIMHDKYNGKLQTQPEIINH